MYPSKNIYLFIFQLAHTLTATLGLAEVCPHLFVTLYKFIILH